MDTSRYIAFASACLLLCCCTKGGVEDVSLETPISFDADIMSTSETTKGVPTTPLNASSIGIYAYFTETKPFSEVVATATPNWLNNEAVRRSGSNPWATAEVIYWPAYNAATLQSKLSFFAYIPRATQGDGITLQATTGVPRIQFEIQEDAPSQTDLLLATSARDKNKSQNKGVIALNFAHVLSKVGFRAYCQTPGSTILSISMTNLKYRGEIQMDYPVNWTLTNDTKTFELNLNGMPLSSDPTKPTHLSEPNNYFMMFPVNHGASSRTVLTVVYKEEKEMKTKTAYITENWEMGKSILYSLNLGGNTTEDMMIESVTIDAWTVSGKEDIETN